MPAGKKKRKKGEDSPIVKKKKGGKGEESVVEPNQPRKKGEGKCYFFHTT